MQRELKADATGNGGTSAALNHRLKYGARLSDRLDWVPAKGSWQEGYSEPLERILGDTTNAGPTPTLSPNVKSKDMEEKTMSLSRAAWFGTSRFPSKTMFGTSRFPGMGYTMTGGPNLHPSAKPNPNPNPTPNPNPNPSARFNSVRVGPEHKPKSAKLGPSPSKTLSGQSFNGVSLAAAREGRRRAGAATAAWEQRIHPSSGGAAIVYTLRPKGSREPPAFLKAKHRYASVQRLKWQILVTKLAICNGFGAAGVDFGWSFKETYSIVAAAFATEA
mmetsp:Transcript_28117/g.89904  ORF Transcript_28117/g.89904 Transcript_28117/m.89904 type:complete len:275 (-) Transcript_28117:61-885(-)